MRNLVAHLDKVLFALFAVMAVAVVVFAYRDRLPGLKHRFLDPDLPGARLDGPGQQTAVRH